MLKFSDIKNDIHQTKKVLALRKGEKKLVWRPAAVKQFEVHSNRGILGGWRTEYFMYVDSAIDRYNEV